MLKSLHVQPRPSIHMSTDGNPFAVTGEYTSPEPHTVSVVCATGQLRPESGVSGPPSRLDASQYLARKQASDLSLGCAVTRSSLLRFRIAVSAPPSPGNTAVEIDPRLQKCRNSALAAEQRQCSLVRLPHHLLTARHPPSIDLFGGGRHWCCVDFEEVVCHDQDHGGDTEEDGECKELSVGYHRVVT